jgi:hypothetical protein
VGVWREELEAELLERMKSVEEEKIMASQKLADSDVKMAGLQKVGTRTPVTLKRRVYSTGM